MRHLLTLLLTATLALPLLAGTSHAKQAPPSERKPETIAAPAAGTPEAAIGDLLRAGLKKNFADYLALLHPEERSTEEQRSQKERYEWKRFSQQAAWYAATREPLTFVIAKREPQGETKLKVFLVDQKNKNRSPVPVMLVRADGRWHVWTNSL